MGDELTFGVECHSGYEYAERPIAFIWENRRLAIEAIETQWCTPDGKRFRVRIGDGRTFELSYRETDDTWQVKPA